MVMKNEKRKTNEKDLGNSANQCEQHI